MRQSERAHELADLRKAVAVLRQAADQPHLDDSQREILGATLTIGVILQSVIARLDP